MESTSQKNETSPLKVLIADDDTPTRILLRAAISQWGYEIVEAKDGEEALAILQQAAPPKLVILDWLMPKLDGIAVCEKCKKELSYRPYVILLTQVSGTTNLIKALDAGADEFLSKPFNMAELRSRLSIGSRIVRYEDELTEQNIELKKYVNQTKTLTQSILNVTKKMEEDIKTSENALPTAKQLSEQVAAIIKNIQKFEEEIKKEK